MTLLYPLSIVRRNNHLVVAERSEQSTIAAGKSYCPRTNPTGFLNAQDHILGAATSAYRHRHVAFVDACLDLSGEDFVETDVVPDRGEDRRVSCQRKSPQRRSYILELAD